MYIYIYAILVYVCPINTCIYGSIQSADLGAILAQAPEISRTAKRQYSDLVDQQRWLLLEARGCKG